MSVLIFRSVVARRLLHRAALTGACAVAAFIAGACARSDSSSADAAARSRSGATAGSVAAAATAATTVASAVADTDDFGAALPTDASASSRIVSLNPMATEVLFALGANDRLVGRSAWDEYPAQAKAIPSAGDGIKPNVEAVLGLKPTLVILYATAENRAAADAFRRAGVRTMSLRVDHIADFMTFTTRLGRAVGEEARAQVVRDTVARTLDAVRTAMKDAPRKRVVWPVWLSPVMVIGGGSFLDELLVIAGGENVMHDRPAPSPQVSVEEVARLAPDFIVTSAKQRATLLASVPWHAVRAVRDSQFIITQDELTGRPSVVLGMAAVSLARALHPERAATLPK